MTRSWVGESVKRLEDEALLRGTAPFTADIDRHGALEAVFVRSLSAHALVGTVDLGPARTSAGVVGTWTLEQLGLARGILPGHLWEEPPPELAARVEVSQRAAHQPILASERVLFQGEPMAVLVAADRYAAEDAAEQVEVNYRELPPVMSAAQALAPDAVCLHPDWEDNVAAFIRTGKGDPASAVAGADLVVRESFAVQRLAGLPLETRGCVADFDPIGGELTLWSSTQIVHALRRVVAKAVGLAESHIRVVSPNVGGGFGVKGVVYPEEVVVARLAMLTRRPVRWIEDRAEHFQSAIHARDQVHEVELALDRDGRILALRDSLVVDVGAHNPLGIVIPYNTIAHLCGPYQVPAFDAKARCVVTNKVPAAPYRGAGRPEAVFAMERALDLAASRLGLDPLELRRRNLVRPDQMPYSTGLLYRDGQPIVYDSGDYPAALTTVASMVRDKRGGGTARAGAGGAAETRTGFGVAMYVEGTGIGPFEGASVEIRDDGTLVVRVGSCSQGQGHRTAFAQICAAVFQLDPERVQVVGGDSDAIAYGWGTVASRSAVVGGNAVSNAAHEVRHKTGRLAAYLLEAAEEDLVFEDGHVHVAGSSGRSLSLQELARRAEPGHRRPDGMAPGLLATSYFEPATVTWSYGAHAALVEVNVRTGEVRVLRYAVVHDAGRLLNPLIAEGQVVGGVAQGIGAALLESLVYAEDGALLTASLMDYLVPTSLDMPPLQVVHQESPSPVNPLGIKGLGEGGAIPGPAVLANAVEDALRSYGAVVRRTPLAPEYVLSLCGR